MKIGNVEIKNKVFLAPMAGITDMAYRTICKEKGAGLLYTEMVSAKGIYYNDEKTRLLTAISETERPVAIQIFGSDPDIMANVAKKLSKDADIIDINMGCPAPKVVKNDDGSKLMLNPKLINEITKKVVEASEVPVTIKIRKGWDEDNINAVEIAQIAEANKISAITVHGRTREQFYSGKADWDIIKKVKETVNIPVIGNGDVVDNRTAHDMIEYTKCDAIMVGRASLGNPWIFEQIDLNDKHKENIRPTNEEIYKTILKHYDLLEELKGEYVAIREMRKHISWYVKGIPMATEIRKQINEIENKNEVKEILKKHLLE